MSEVEFVLGWAFTLFSASLQTPLNVVCLHSLCKRVGSIGQCVTARPDVLSAALQLYIHTVRQGLSHPCRWTPRLAHGVPEGSKRSHPNNNNKHLAAVQCSATTNR